MHTQDEIMKKLFYIIIVVVYLAANFLCFSYLKQRTYMSGFTDGVNASIKVMDDYYAIKN